MPWLLVNVTLPLIVAGRQVSGRPDADASSGGGMVSGGGWMALLWRTTVFVLVAWSLAYVAFYGQGEDEANVLVPAGAGRGPVGPGRRWPCSLAYGWTGGSEGLVSFGAGAGMALVLMVLTVRMTGWQGAELPEWRRRQWRLARLHSDVARTSDAASLDEIKRGDR